nr:hypothetical protein [Protofrankia symbiont of Coriaria ruscifolia]
MELDGDIERTLVVDYSTGMRKKIGLAAALLHGPKLLVLDEPFEAVDPVSAATLKRLLTRFVAAGGSVLLSSHVMALVEQLCDTVMARGRVVAEGLLGAAYVGITTAVTFTAFTAMVVFAARLGTVSVIVSIPALLLQVTLVVLLSRLTARLFGVLARSRTGGAVTAVITAAMLVLSQSGWIVFIALDAVLTTGFSHGFSMVVRSFPSSWGLLAVEAAARSHWLWTVGPLVALAVLVVALLALWSRLLGPPRLARAVVRGSSRAPARERGATGAVYAKEMRTWLRDPLRVQSLVVAPVFAIFSGVLPLLFDSTVFLPFVGALTALMGAVSGANLYGQDGTALWLTLLVPASEEADVRGRQWAWLTLFGPLSLVLTVVGTAPCTVPSGRGRWPPP